jgi:hypothetical protein
MQYRENSFSTDLINWIASLGIPWIEIAGGMLKLEKNYLED